MKHENAASDWAELADIIVGISQELLRSGHAIPGVVPLTALESRVLRFVDRNPGRPSSEVAIAAGVSRSNLSDAIRGLAEKGLIERIGDPDDRRRVLLSVTTRASASIAALRAHWAGQLTDLPSVEQAPPTEVAAFLSSLEHELSARRAQNAGRRPDPEEP